MYVEVGMYNVEKKMGEGLGRVVEVILGGGWVVIERVRSFLVVVVWIVGGVGLGLSVWEGLEWRVGEWLRRYIWV